MYGRRYTNDELLANWGVSVQCVGEPDAVYEYAYRTAYEIVIRMLLTPRELVELTKQRLLKKLMLNNGVDDGSDYYTQSDFERLSRDLRDIMAYPTRKWPGFAEALDVALTECWMEYMYRVGGEMYHSIRQNYEALRAGAGPCP